MPSREHTTSSGPWNPRRIAWWRESVPVPFSLKDGARSSMATWKGCRGHLITAAGVKFGKHGYHSHERTEKQEENKHAPRAVLLKSIANLDPAESKTEHRSRKPQNRGILIRVSAANILRANGPP